MIGYLTQTNFYVRPSDLVVYLRSDNMSLDASIKTQWGASAPSCLLGHPTTHLGFGKSFRLAGESNHGPSNREMCTLLLDL